MKKRRKISGKQVKRGYNNIMEAFIGKKHKELLPLLKIQSRLAEPILTAGTITYIIDITQRQISYWQKMGVTTRGKGEKGAWSRYSIADYLCISVFHKIRYKIGWGATLALFQIVKEHITTNAKFLMHIFQGRNIDVLLNFEDEPHFYFLPEEKDEYSKAKDTIRTSYFVLPIGKMIRDALKKAGFGDTFTVRIDKDERVICIIDEEKVELSDLPDSICEELET